MDSLFNSVKLYHTLYRAEALAHGVVWLNRHGIPTAIIQKEEKHRDCAEKLRGTTHTARLANVPGCPNTQYARCFNIRHKGSPYFDFVNSHSTKPKN